MMTVRPRERRKARREPRGENSVTKQSVEDGEVVSAVAVADSVAAVPLSSVMPSNANRFSCFNCLGEIKKTKPI